MSRILRWFYTSIWLHVNYMTFSNESRFLSYELFVFATFTLNETFRCTTVGTSNFVSFLDLRSVPTSPNSWYQNCSSSFLIRSKFHERCVTEFCDWIRSLSPRSFQGKTEYSQAKYVRKKQKKYFEFISVHEPSVRLVASMYYMQDPLKIMSVATLTNADFHNNKCQRN